MVILFKIIISIKPYLVTSNGERLIVYNILRNGFLWSKVVFEKEVDFETSDSELIEVSKTSIWKHFIAQGSMFGLVECDLHVHPALQKVFQEMTPIFKKSLYKSKWYRCSYNARLCRAGRSHWQPLFSFGTYCLIFFVSYVKLILIQCYLWMNFTFPIIFCLFFCKR